MRRRVSLKSRIANGRLVLLLVGAVTAVDLILKAFSVNLVFPCEIYLPLWMIMTGREDLAGFGYALGILLSVFFLLFFLFVTVGEKRGDRHPVPFRIGWVLTGADTVFYFVISVSSITTNGVTVSNLIEFAFHVFCVIVLYLADRAMSGKDGDPDREEDPPETKQEERKSGDDPDDEGIQW